MDAEERYGAAYLAAVDDARSTIVNRDISSDQVDYTYGNFVDMVRTRKAIERYRKVQRLVRSANVETVLNLLGNTREQFSDQLETRGRWLDVLEEMVNQDVKKGSGQSATVDPVSILDHSPGRDD